MMKEIMQKYNIRAPRYTSYPPATEFSEKGISMDSCNKILMDSNKVSPENISIYLHFPYCPQTCLFCGCNSYLQKSEEKAAEYVDAMIQEITSVSDRLDLSRPVTQIHWGGGTPNSLNYTQIGRIMDVLHRRLNLSGKAEVAMECNPAYLKPQHIKDLKSMGFNRLSLGIQDFNPAVLKAVNREPSLLPIDQLLELIRAEGFDGVNLDFIYGLPLQNKDSFIENLEKAIELKPDRLVTFSYAHVPWVRDEQKKLESLHFPAPDEKLDMFLGGMKKMLSAGYKMIGMDHYALPGDILAQASEKGQLHRNFQGYCTRETTGQVYAFGASAISQLGRAYLQNIKHPDKYIEAINSDSFAIQRGYELNDSEVIIRSAITELMCNGVFDIQSIGTQNSISADEVRAIFSFKEDDFKDLENDGLLEIRNDRLTLSEMGKLLSRVVAMRLDPKITEETKFFSKTI